MVQNNRNTINNLNTNAVKKILVLLLLSVWMIPPVSFAQGQKRYTLEGKVTLFGSEEPIPYANVCVKELNLWGFTDVDGKFMIKGILPGSYTLEATSLGYQSVKMPVTISKDVTGFRFQLKEDNLTLDDVVVTAKAGTGMNSSSKIDKTAIQHLQASSLADVMQLLPGSLIQNPTLSAANTITIRHIGSDDYNARGVGLLVNGSRISNDAEIGDPDLTAFTNTIDYRKLSADNIESVEVLKGVVSAEYGDMTSGAILVTTKAGLTPLEIRIKTDPQTKSMSASKGFGLGKDKGNVNIDFDYARSFKDWISPVDTYDRTTMGLTYSNTFNKDKTPFRFNARLSGYLTGNSVTSDPDVSKQDFSKRRDNNISLSIYGNWMLNKSWISTLNYNVSANYGRKYYQTYIVNSTNPVATTNTMIEGIALGYYTPANYIEDRRSEDKPLYINAKITGDLNKRVGEALLKTKIGIEWNTKGNLGRGVYHEADIPKFERERKYSDIPFMSDLSLFVEEKVSLPIGNGNLELMAGVRFNKMVIEGYNYDPTVDPRLNARYSFIKNKRKGFLRSLAVSGGWGIMQRLPSISYLYPAPKYIDNPLFLYRNTTTEQYMALIQTSIVDDRLPYNLKPERTSKFEIGLDFNILGVTGILTYFNEDLKDGISGNASFLSESFDYYDDVTDINAAPKYENGRIYVNDGNGNYSPLNYTTQRQFKSYSRPDNRGRVKKWGIEYDFNFGKIEAINTSVLMTGSYIKSESTTPGLEYSYSNSQDPINVREKFPYVGIYEGQKQLSLGSAKDRMSTNISLVTNVPSLRLVVSLTAQCIWMNRSWNIYDEGNIYTVDDQGNHVYGDYDNKPLTSNLYRNPIAYMDLDGTIRPFSDYYTTNDNDLKRRLDMLRLANDWSFYFLKTRFNPYFMANIRITKELGKLAALSFYANNFTNSTPVLKNKARPNHPGARVNTPIYFGAELKLTF